MDTVMTSSSTVLSRRGAALTLGAIGVVFGDIGTSPLYAFREALSQGAADGIQRVEIMGVLSLALWALILVVTVKYVLFLMRADNHGEGGVLSLMALAGRQSAPMKVITVLGAAGAALFFGDAIITPALSVLSAVEGLKTVPGLEAMPRATILIGTTAILITLFLVQSGGTHRVARLFGPICLIWFFTLGGLGILHIWDAPEVLLAFLPGYGVSYLLTHGVTGLFVLGAVFLTVTGAEALTADMGHFGKGPIRLGWFSIVFPALVLNYLGQGAFALGQLKHASASGVALANADWFFLLAPSFMRLPLVLLAALATIIASQAVITGAYSLTQQAIQLGLFPRMTIRQTSPDHAGQIYVPLINWLLLIGVLYLVFMFRTSSAMAAAYGIAVTGTMVMTTCLAFFVLRGAWHWSLPRALLLIMPFLALDLFFFGANALRIVEGGWVPLVVAAVIALLIATWLRGRKILSARLRDDMISIDDLANSLAARGPREVDGTAVFLTSNNQAAPAALLHNLKHNRVLHAQNVVLAVQALARPYVAPSERLEIIPLNDRFARATLSYGFMEQPDVPADLLQDGRIRVGPGGLSFFISRNSVGRARGRPAMPIWQEIMFIFLQKNAADPTAYFRIPPNRVLELGSRIEL